MNGFNLSNVSLLECDFFIVEKCSILSLYETQMGMSVTQLRTGDTCCDFSMLEFLKRKIYPKVNNKYENAYLNMYFRGYRIF